MIKKRFLIPFTLMILVVAGNCYPFISFSSAFHSVKNHSTLKNPRLDALNIEGDEAKRSQGRTPPKRKILPSKEDSSNANVTSFVSPDSSYSTIISELQKAENNIFLLIYEFYHPKLFTALKDAVVNDSVALTLLLEKDTGYGGSGSKDEYNRYYAHQFWQLSQDYNVNVYWETEWPYMHSKLMIIDNKTTIVMSANMEPASIPSDLTETYTDYETFSRQWGVVIHGQQATQSYLDYVQWELNSLTAPYDPDTDGTGKKPTFSNKVSYTPEFTTTTRSNVSITPVFSPNNSFERLNESIYAADHYILLQLMYISWGESLTNKANQLVYALGNATARNVSVLVILEDDMDYYEGAKQVLTNRGIHVIPANCSSGYPLFIHNKGVIIDDSLVFVGSINWSQYSLKYNRETGALIHSTGIARWFKEVYKHDWDKTGRIFDVDQDGLPDLYEEEHNLDPSTNDTDGDGTPDYEEVFPPAFPAITISSPVSTQALNTSEIMIQWRGKSGNFSIDHYEIRINQQTWISVGNASSYTVSSLQDGNYIIEVKIVTKEGKIAIDSIGITIDTVAPSVSITNPIQNTTIRKSNVSLNWTSSDVGSGIDYFLIKIDGDPWKEIGKNTTYMILGLRDGTHLFQIKGVDRAENIAKDRIQIVVNTSPLGGPGMEEELIVIAIVFIFLLIVYYVRRKKE